MDGPGVHDYPFNEGVSFVVECDTQEEIDYLWEYPLGAPAFESAARGL